jgi:hypothetical protein
MMLDIRAAKRYELFVLRVAERLGILDYDKFIDVTVRKHCDGGMLGWCHYDGEIAWIEVAKEDLPHREVCAAIAHEMVHARQHFRGDLDSDAKSFKWKGRRCHLPYDKQPWEIEAANLEYQLANYCLDNNNYK